MIYLRRLIFSFFLAIFAVTASASESPVVDTGKVNAQLVSSHDRAAPGETFHVALRTLLDPQWHTYWRNSGDSGEPVQITWKLPEEVTAGDIIWPLPKPIATGPIINYGFDDRAIFPVPFKLSRNATPGDVIDIEADIYYLVCKDICIPEDTTLSISVEVGETQLHDRWNEVINIARNVSPKLSNIEAGIVASGADVVLNFANLPEGNYSAAHFFPFSQGVINHSAAQKAMVTDLGVQLKTEPGYDWAKGGPKTANGVLSFSRDGVLTGHQVEVAVGSAPDIGIIAAAPPQPAGASQIGLFGAIIGAFLGGLILNIMPCVFPVISIKALSIAKSAHGERGAIRKDAWAYTFGVLMSFLSLTIALLIFKAGGSEIGWGFQLQDPRVIGFLALLLFAVGLNLLGVFEIGGSFQNTGQGLTQKSGFTGSFFTGVLAVIVATPCTAPLMAGATGYAFTQPALITIAVFMALGLGFALPFLLLAYIPALTKLLPKPGDWMVRFKEFLAFPMFAAAIWLIWVLVQQSGELGLRNILLAILGLGFAIWLLKQNSKLAKALGAINLIGTLALPLTLHADAVELHSEAWSNEKVAQLRSEGKPVFVDFTAAWCVSCKVNELTVLNTEVIQNVFKSTNTAFLTADWTNKNDVIARELEKYGRSGVPLYLLYPSGNNDVNPAILPQILTKSMVEEKLKKNANP